MSWRDNLIDANFREVPFKILDSRTLIGRRNVLHEYPFKDIPFLQDLGQKADKFILNAYVLQNSDNSFDYFTERNNLINALKEGGTGKLEHPFLGIIEVGVLGDVPVDESFREGGIARFRITFVQSGLNIFPTITQDVKSKVDNAVSNSITQATTGFVNTAKTDDAPDFSLNTTITTVNSYFSLAKASIATVKNAPAAAISRAFSLIASLEATVSDVITIPSDLALTIQQGFNSYLGLVGLFEEDFGQVEPSIDLLVSTIQSVIEQQKFGEESDSSNASSLGGTVEPIIITTPTSAQQSANNVSVVNHVRANSLFTAMRIAVLGIYDSYDQAIEIMNLVVDAVDGLLEKLGVEAGDTSYSNQNVVIADEDTYGALENAKPVFITSMLQIGAKLARIIEFEVPTEITPALIVAYDRYKDIDREDDIVDRNIVITHPGFLPNKQNIEILSE